MLKRTEKKEEGNEMAEKGIVNGVNVDNLFGVVDAITGNSKIADFQFRVTNKWVNGGHSRSNVGDFHGALETQTRQPFILDSAEHPVLLGEDQAPNPVEFVLHGLAGCLTTSLVYHAAARGHKITKVESTLEGDLDLHGFLGMDEKVRSGYSNIRITMKVEGDVPEETLAELIEVAKARSPVFDAVSNPVSVSVQLGK